MKKPVAVPDGQLKSNTFSEEMNSHFYEIQKIENPEKAICCPFSRFSSSALNK
jgi:hypothetical protein